jgi:polyadenylate-binding protein 2
MTEKREQSPRIDDDANVDEELQQMQARLLQMEAEKNAVRQVASRSLPLADGTQIAEPTAGSSTPKEANGHAADAEGDQAMDEDEPGAVDARSIYIGNVRRLSYFSKSRSGMN